MDDEGWETQAVRAYAAESYENKWNLFQKSLRATERSVAILSLDSDCHVANAPRNDRGKRDSLFAIAKGSIATGMLLLVYFSVVSVISGWSFALNQFRQFWYYVVALSIGFGVQVGLFSFLRSLHKEASAGMIATSATTSTVAMLSCCAHYLVNFTPILGVTGLVTLFTQYQIQFFWVGIAANLFGIAYLLSQLAQYRRYEIA